MPALLFCCFYFFPHKPYHQIQADYNQCCFYDSRIFLYVHQNNFPGGSQYGPQRHEHDIPDGTPYDRVKEKDRHINSRHPRRHRNKASYDRNAPAKQNRLFSMFVKPAERFFHILFLKAKQPECFPFGQRLQPFRIQRRYPLLNYKRSYRGAES